MGLSTRQTAVCAGASFACLLCATAAVLVGEAPSRLLDPFLPLLAGFALASNLVAAKWDETLEISASLVAALIAGAFIGPMAAFVVVLAAEGISWAIERLRPIALPQNILGIGVPAVFTAEVLDVVAPRAEEGGLFFVLLGLMAVAAVGLNTYIVRLIHLLHDGRTGDQRSGFLKKLLPVWAVNVGLMMAIVSIYAVAEVSGAALLLAGTLAFTYQLRLVAEAEERSRRHTALSWGVLSGMVRNLDMRDSRTARHSAAVARFARDIAVVAGMSARDRELAHTAGLLHDVGKFALSDRVMERGVGLTDEDWRGIRRHPDLGATMLQDVGGYGPIAEIVRAHHERLDGRGYPRGLTGDQIPEVAKVVAVAEVYDALTAEDGYRASMSSFEALRELRRSAGTQLESRYVEALASALSGTGVEYRHAGRADFDSELALERRIGEALGAAESS